VYCPPSVLPTECYSGRQIRKDKTGRISGKQRALLGDLKEGYYLEDERRILKLS
jgi:hypothetical protein